jgi:hypothetical protein
MTERAAHVSGECDEAVSRLRSSGADDCDTRSTNLQRGFGVQPVRVIPCLPNAAGRDGRSPLLEEDT